jgi:predicted nuclease with TOPRIM domain
MNLDNKNPKGAGRKKKFSQDQVIDAIDKFVLYNEIDGISASKIAKFAQSKLGYTEMEYYHITQYEAACNKIEDLKKERKLVFLTDDILTYRSIPIDTLVESLIKSPSNLKNYLLDTRNSNKALYDKIIQKSEENKKLKHELKELRNKDDSEKQQKKELLNTCKDLKDKVNTLRKLIDFENQIKMCKYVWEHTLIEPNGLADQYIKSLLYCGVISSSDVVKITNTGDLSIKNHGLEEDDRVINLFNVDAKDIEMEFDQNEIDILNKENTTSVDDLRDLLGINR